MKKPDKYGWFRQQEYCGSSRKGHYNFYRKTKNLDVTFWINKSETINNTYIVEKSTHLGNYQFQNKVITQFKTATEAKIWVNEEYEHLFN